MADPVADDAAREQVKSLDPWPGVSEGDAAAAGRQRLEAAMDAAEAAGALLQGAVAPAQKEDELVPGLGVLGSLVVTNYQVGGWEPGTGNAGAGEGAVGRVRDAVTPVPRSCSFPAPPMAWTGTASTHCSAAQTHSPTLRPLPSPPTCTMWAGQASTPASRFAPACSPCPPPGAWWAEWLGRRASHGLPALRDCSRARAVACTA